MSLIGGSALRRRAATASRTVRTVVLATVAASSAVTLPAQSSNGIALRTVGLAFQDSVATWMAHSHVPLVAVGIIQDGRVASVSTFGDTRSAAAQRSPLLYNVASLTKPVTAATALALVSEGRLALDESLDPYWIDPDIKDDPRHTKLTPRLILSHQTGFPNWRRTMPDHKLGFLADPGTRLTYSGAGYEYLREALEHKFNRSLQQLADSLVFTPAGMRETTYGWDGRKDTARFAVGYDTNGIALVQSRHAMDKANAADWLVTTIADYSRFAAYVLNGAGLQAGVLAQMTAPQIGFEGKPNEAMGLGWEVMGGPPSDRQILLHTGSDDGVRTMVVLLPQSRRGIVVFANGDRGMDVIVNILRTSLALEALTH